MLSGHAGTGPARYIGKATRIRARQNELAELDTKRAELESELSELISQIVAYEQQIVQLQEQQSLLRKLLKRSKLEECYAALTQAYNTLESSRSKYQKAHQQTQELRQRYNALLAQLEHESEGNNAFASEGRRVQAALLAMVKLKNQARAAQQQLRTVAYTWEEYQKLRVAQQQALANETNVDNLTEHVRTQSVQVQAEMNELQRVAASSNAEELSLRLVKGLQIAAYLMERYPGRCLPWHIDVAAYALAIQADGISANEHDLRMLDTLPAVFTPLVETMQT